MCYAVCSPIVSVRDSQLYPPRREATQKNEDELTRVENAGEDEISTPFLDTFPDYSPKHKS